MKGKFPEVSKRQLVSMFIITPLILALIVYLVTSIVITSWLWAIAGVIVIQIFQSVFQFIVSRLMRVFGIGLLLLNCFVGYGLAVWFGLSVLPGLESISFTDSIIVAWLYALVITILQWAFISTSDSYLLNQISKKHAKNGQKRSTKPGFIFVQLDGVSSHILDWQLKAGNIPNIKQLIDSGEYTFTGWRTQIPSTTPASQAGILLGNNDGIPAFRWYERERGGLVVANQTEGAKLIEKRLSSGKGLLADGGVSLGNLFSGDAAESIMVMSKLNANPSSKNTMSQYSAYFSSPYGFMRSFVLSIGEMAKEIFQARRQKTKNVTPRVERHGSYILLRAATNVLLRDLQTKIVLDKMVQGVNSLYVDYLDYDEIAHHAGIARPESLDALDGLDRVVGILTKARAYVSRPYHIVFVSDHGQSQGPTFKQLNNDVNLEQLLTKILKTKNIQLSSEESGTPTSAQELASVQKLPGRLKKSESKSKIQSDTEVVVTCSGNLGNIWLVGFKKRPTQEQIEKSHPKLFNKLLATKGIGLVLINSAKNGPLAIGKNGSIRLTDSKVTGDNPLDAYPGATTQELLKLRTMKNTPDLQLISDYNQSTGEVFAFEELVGNHGGIGGWQTDAMLLHPSSLIVKNKFYKTGQIIDSTTIHKIFIDWLETAGQRKSIR